MLVHRVCSLFNTRAVVVYSHSWNINYIRNNTHHLFALSQRRWRRVECTALLLGRPSLPLLSAMSLPGQAKPLSQSPDSMHRIKKRNRKSKPKPIELRKWVLLRNGRRAERQWLLLRDSAQEQRLIFLPSAPLTPVTPNAATKRRHSAVRFGHSLPASLFRTSSQFLWKDQPASPLPPTPSTHKFHRPSVSPL